MLGHIADSWYLTTVRSMINRDLAKASDQYGTLLHYAAEQGNTGMARYLIELESEVDAIGKHGKTPLMLAVQNNYLETVVLLLKSGANVETADANGQTALQVALGRRYGISVRSEIIQAILLSVKTKASTIDELVDKLLAVNCSFPHAAHLRDTEVLKRLLQRGFDVNSTSHDKETALHVAAEFNDLEMAILLIDHRADVNALDQLNNGPLYYAARNRSAAMVRILLENEANPNCINSFYGCTPLYVLFANGPIVDAEEFDECVAMLLQNGAVPKNPRFVSETFLNCALNQRNSRGTDYLIAHLAMLEMIGTPTIPANRRFSDATDRLMILKFEENYKVCRQILDTVVFEKLSLLHLLAESEYKMRIRVRNETIVTGIEDSFSKHELDKLCPYYYDTLMRRISKARRTVKLEDKAISVICDVFEKSYNECYPAAREIFSYLSERDLMRLCQL